jgi:peptidoglycan/LPS O-acetylase OafA/YrhL
VNLAFVALIAGVFSALTYRFVERPALRRKRSTRPEAIPIRPSAPELPLALAGDAVLQ